MTSIQRVIDKFVGFYTSLDAASLSVLPEIYHSNAVLIDPFGHHQGLKSIEGYFRHLLENIKHCRFDIDEPFYDGQRFAVSWVMHWSHPRVAGGKALSLPGCSFGQVQHERIVQQRDYYDAGEMIYEHLPILGGVVRSVKRRVSA